MLKHICTKWPEWPKPFSFPSPPSPPYKILPLKGFGPGMVATRSIARGQTIVVERPLLLYPRAMPAFLPLKTLAETLEKAVDSLLPENREAVYAMKNSKGPEYQSHLQGIIVTNSLGIFEAMPGYPAAYAGLPRDIARANHSCSPNSVYTWDLETATFTLRALCPIRPGEQITINYVELDQPRRARQQELKSEFKLECKCKACKQEPFALWLSDQRRLFMSYYCARAAYNEQAFEKWLEEGAPAQPPHDRLVPLTGLDLDIARLDNMDGFRRAEVMYSAMEEEGVYPPGTWERVLTTLVRAHSVLENENGVKKYALIVALLTKAFTGSDGGWAAVARSPTQTEWWGKLGDERVF
ncbi:hypothetical protein C8Q80DRAFT_1138317 [Daedaleopsis nitida]|nr:hypothetical protein C8Q80DRAFT_1138317 [Daedaleopsis nitida]